MPTTDTERVKAYQDRIRAKAIAHYGGACACCGESESIFLTFDHVNGDGAAHRREMGYSGGHAIVFWLRKHNYPDTIQLLCYNCNMAKAFGRYGCPHKEVRYP